MHPGAPLTGGANRDEATAFPPTTITAVPLRPGAAAPGRDARHRKGARTLDEIRQWAIAAARAADDKRGTGTLVLEVGKVLAITDAFVITSGSNRRQVLTIAEEVETAVKAAGGPAPLRTEGLTDAQWVLLDYGDFVVHVFLEEARSYYDLERLWADAPRWEWDNGARVAAR